MSVETLSILFYVLQLVQGTIAALQAGGDEGDEWGVSAGEFEIMARVW